MDNNKVSSAVRIQKIIKFAKIWINPRLMKKSANALLYSFAASAAAVSATSCDEQQKQDDQQYNIVFIMTDDHTGQMMSCYDNRYIKTPNLDENVGRVLDYLDENGLKAELVSLQQKYNDPIESVLTEKSR